MGSPEFADEFDDDDESEEGSKGATANSHGAFNFDDADDVDKVPETELDDPLEQNENPSELRSWPNACGVLGDIVNEVPIRFYSDRQILDEADSFLSEVHSMEVKSKKKQSLLFKVDFENAYDSVSPAEGKIFNEGQEVKDQGNNMRDFMYNKVAMAKSTKFWDLFGLAQLNEPSLDNNFRRSIRGGIEQSQFKELTDLLIPIVLNPCPDRWFWSLEGSGVFCASIGDYDDQRLLTMDSKTLWIKVPR
ncbi:hypothetical protein Tco_1155105 [Tanacetum coccineum]